MALMIEEIISPLVTTEWGRRAGIGVIVLMSIFSVVTLIMTVIALRADYRFSQAKISLVSASVINDSAKDINRIPDLHLFGQLGVQSAREHLPVTSLQVRLIGIVKSNTDNESRVIISEEDHPGKVYQVGDTLSMSGVKIQGVATDGVILDNGGILEKLPLQRSQLNFQGMPKSMIERAEDR